MKGKVLIIDDEIDLCLMIRHYLTKKNYEVTCAHSIFDGMCKMAEFAPNSLLLDNNLPDGLGWNHAAAIHAAYPAMHITLISANTLMPLEFTGVLFTWIEKPISLSNLEKYL